MTLDQLVAYLMTHSERIAAVRDGRETETEQRSFLTDMLADFFDGERPRLLRFAIPIDVYVRGEPASLAGDEGSSGRRRTIVRPGSAGSNPNRA